MKIYEMVRAADWKYVRPQLIKEYPYEGDTDKLMEAYEQAYLELQNTEPNYNEKLFDIEYIEPIEENEGYHHCYFTKDGERYGMDFMSWNDVLGMELTGTVFRNYNAYQICAHLLWEITFYGWSNKEVQERANGLDSIGTD